MQKNEKNLTESIENKIGSTLMLDKTGSWPATPHYFEKKPAYAVISALASSRPLLVKGEPGLGKSQLARAIAHILKRKFISIVIQPQTEYEDLLWGIDHTQRLGDAQMASLSHETQKLKDYRNYIGPGALWWAFNWDDAVNQSRFCSHNFLPADFSVEPGPSEHGVVLLIDEIDKAPVTLANSLLEALGNSAFPVPPLNKTVLCTDTTPLVVLTTNDTRELPAALERRCVVLKMKLPDDLEQHLTAMGETHFPEMDEDVRNEAARQIVADRKACQDLPKTGQAEYIDLLRALDNVTRSKEEQLQWLEKLSQFFFKSK